MNTKTFTCAVFSVAAPCAFAAAMQVVGESVALSYDSGTGDMAIAYELAGDEPCVVTIGIETNAAGDVWKAVKGPDICGDANRMVWNPGAKKAYWMPNRDVNGVFPSGGIRAVVKAWATNAPPDYVAIDIVSETSVAMLTTNNVRYYESAAAVPGGVSAEKYKTDTLLMRKIPAALVKWKMGSPTGESGRGSDETQHWVTLSNDYYIGVYEFTKGQYYKAKGTYDGSGYSGNGPNGLQFDGPMIAAEYMSMNNLRGTPTTAAANPDGFFGWPRSRHTVASDSLIHVIRGRTGFEVDLPTEAQWEYACRAGTGTTIYTGSNAYANAPGNFNGGSVVAVGRYTPNSWGLYDMYGNVGEFVLDRYAAYTADDAFDPVGADGEGAFSGDSACIMRGASFYQAGAGRRSASREPVKQAGTKTKGFRLVCPAIAVR